MAVGRPRNHCSNPRLLLVALVVTLTAALLLAVDSRSAQASAAVQGRTVFGPLVPPGDRVLVGAYVEARGDFTDADRRASVEAHEASIGRPLDIVNEFFSFSKPWAMDRLAWHIEQGRTPMVSWNGTHADDILAGRHDELIRERARDAKQLEVTFLLRFFWEMDAAKGRNWGYHDDPTLYHRVWKHVRTIFDQEGVDNAVWVWTPTTWHFTTGKAAEFYPGDDVVDWIGADGYQWSCTGDGLDSFGAVYRDFLTWAAGKNKPVIAAEWGADESPAKVPFIQSVPEVLAGYPNIVALVAFDSIDPGGRGCNFRIDTSAAALQAYRALVNDAPFVPSTPTTTLLIPETSVTTVVPTTVTTVVPTTVTTVVPTTVTTVVPTTVTTVPDGLPRGDDPIDPPPDPDAGLDLRSPMWFDGPIAAPGSIALLVVGDSTEMAVADVLVADRLKALGLDVRVVSDEQLGPHSEPDADVILISATVSSDAIGGKLSWRPTPIMVWKPWLFDDLWLTDAMPDVTFGSILAAPGRHAIEGRDIDLVSKGRVPYVRPAPGGHVILTISDAPVLVRWNKGNQLAGGRMAPACRSTFFGYHSTMESLTAQGWAQFDQNLNWLMGDCQAQL